jgi:hypothetical protein
VFPKERCGKERKIAVSKSKGGEGR